jgi:hypothetical protein
MDRKQEARAAVRRGRLQRLLEAIADAILVSKPTGLEVTSRRDTRIPTCDSVRLDVDVMLGLTPAVYGLDSLRHLSGGWHRGDLAVYLRYQNGWGKAEFEDAPSHPDANGLVTCIDIDRQWLDAA